jgi:hypothetical protein
MGWFRRERTALAVVLSRRRRRNGEEAATRPQMVGGSHRNQRRARSRKRRFHVAQCQADRRVIEALCRAEPSAQSQPVSFGDVDAHLYVNRAGKNLSASKKRILETAKTELRRQFDRAPSD